MLEPWVRGEGGQIPPPPLRLGLQQTCPLGLLYLERVGNCPKVTQPVLSALTPAGIKPAEAGEPEPVAGLGALEQGEAQLEVGEGEINWAGLHPGWPGSCLLHRSPQLGVG